MAELIRQCPGLEEVTIYHAYMEPQLFYSLMMLPKLHSLEIYHISINDNSIPLDALVQCFSMIGAKDTSALETVHLLNAPYVHDQVIKALARVKSIKNIKLTSSGRYITDEGLSDFAAMSAGTAIQGLELSTLRCIPYSTLGVLGESLTLRRLSITYCHKVDSWGLQQLLIKSKNLGNLHLGGVEFIGPGEDTLAYAKQRLRLGYLHSNYPIMIIGAHNM